MLVEIEDHRVPHFKAPVYAKKELWGLECGGIYSVQTSLLDISHLLHKTGFVKTESVGTVYDVTKCIGVPPPPCHLFTYWKLQIFIENHINTVYLNFDPLTRS